MIPSNNDLLILQDSLEQVRRLCGYTLPEVKPEDFADVVVILGSSRSGSSLLFQTLSDTGSFWSPLGEETPIFRTSGLGWIETTKESDVLSSILPETAKQQIRQAIFCELHKPGPADISPEYLDQCVRRLLWQWPDEDFRISDLVALAKQNPEWVNLIQRLGLEQGYYDLPGFHPNRRSQLPLPEWFIEEPPFVSPKPCLKPAPHQLKRHPVLLKTSTHAYRMPLIKTLFPRSHIKWIVLTRNPAASINGLMDGWLSNAFHSHNLRDVARLNIDGYTSTTPQGDHWWKFDLPPGWIDYVDRPLVDVCAFQWLSAYSHILAQLPLHSDPVLMVKHEDLVNPATAESAFNKLFEFIGVEPEVKPSLLTSRPIMASETPAPARWLRRQQEISPLLQDPLLRPVAERLGYDLNSAGDLV
jgi:hypothetical protein